MKKVFALLAFGLFSLYAVGQEPDTTQKIVSPGIQAPSEDKTVEIVKDGNTIELKDPKDTTRIKIGKKTISIIEDPSGTSVKVADATEPVEIESDNDNDNDNNGEDNNDEGDKNDHPKHKKMNGHWAGVSWGINNFLTSSGSMSLPPQASFMDLNTSRSWNFNVNFIEHSFGFGTDMLGLVTGMGFSFNNYYFSGNNSIKVDSAGMTVGKYYTDKLDKTKLTATYLNIPLILEFQFPNTKRSDRAYISVGVVGGVKTGAHTKVIYKGQKDKARDDFNLSPIRYAYTARIGYKNVNVYGNYYPVTLFEKDKGPANLYPFDLGLSLTF